MKSKLLVHLTSVVFVTGILLALLATFGGKSATTHPVAEGTQDLSFVDFSNPFQKALALDVMNIFFPGRFDENSRIVSSAASVQNKTLREKLQGSSEKQSLTWGRSGQLFEMFIKFLIVYAIVMLLTYYGVQTIGVWRFCRKKTRSEYNTNRTIQARLLHGLKNAVAGLRHLSSFVPHTSLPIRYERNSIRTRFSS